MIVFFGVQDKTSVTLIVFSERSRNCTTKTSPAQHSRFLQPVAVSQKLEPQSVPLILTQFKLFRVGLWLGHTLKFKASPPVALLSFK
jgi:hypothetical protein